MSGPRYSIIPAAAVLDVRLKGKALQVLALLGSHTDEDGWCSRSQVRMARQLDCARASIHRAIGLLVECGYVQQRERHRPDGGDRSHEYRVLLDEIRPATFISDLDGSDDVENSADIALEAAETGDAPLPAGGQGVSIQNGQGGAHSGRAPNRTTSLSERSGERGARRDPAQERKDALAAAETDLPFVTWFRSWPTSASDSIIRTHAAWLGLAEAERAEAVRCSEAAVLDHTIRLRRKGCYGATIYLEEKRWKMLPDAATAKAGGPATMALPARSLPWFALFWRRVAAGEPVRIMFENMTRGLGYTVRLTEVPGDEETGALVKIEAIVDGRSSPEMVAWTAAMARHGISFNPHTIGMPFVWVPNRWPPGHEQAMARAG